MPDWVTSKYVGGVSEVTLLTPIKKGLVTGELRTYEQRLYGALNALQQRVDQGVPTPISHLPTIHFARWLILRPAQYLSRDLDLLGRQGGPTTRSQEKRPVDPRSGTPEPRLEGFTSWLFFTSNFDGDMKAYLREFSVFLGEDVDKIWCNCEDYPPGGAKDFETFWAYAKRYQLTTHAFSNAYPGMTVARIRQLAAFKDMFDAFVARTRGADGRSIAGLPDAFDQFIGETATIPGRFPDDGGVYQIPASAQWQIGGGR
jgi:hypothetical protein